MIKVLHIDKNIEQPDQDFDDSMIDGYDMAYLTDSCTLQKDRNCNKVIVKEGEDFAYDPLWAFIMYNYYEEDYSKISDEMLMKLIRKYNIDVLQFKDTIYISEDEMADLEQYIYKEYGIKSMDFDD